MFQTAIVWASLAAGGSIRDSARDWAVACAIRIGRIALSSGHAPDLTVSVDVRRTARLDGDSCEPSCLFA
jgi:hypothetical protein